MQIDINQEAEDFPYVQLATQLAKAIEAGDYPPGARMPTIDALIRETGLAPGTVRRAYTLLAERGKVRIVRGRGAFAQPPG